jgi:hypothetical protein
MAYLTYRVEVTRDESRPSGTPSIEITAYIDRVPETDARPSSGGLSRCAPGKFYLTPLAFPRVGRRLVRGPGVLRPETFPETDFDAHFPVLGPKGG